jgi:hypothetical protein
VENAYVRLPLKWCKKKASTHQNRLMTGHKLHLILIGNELHEEDNIQVYNQLAEREREREIEIVIDLRQH